MISIKTIITYCLAISAALLTACGSIHNREAEYTQATSIPELKMPPGVSTEKLDNHYPIPPIKGDKPVVSADLTPPGLIEAENKAEQKTNAQKNKEVTP